MPASTIQAEEHQIGDITQTIAPTLGVSTRSARRGQSLTRRFTL